MVCKKCNQEKKIVNAFHGLCSFCNQDRLDEKKSSKLINHTSNKRKVDLSEEKYTRRSVDKGNKVKRFVSGGRRAGRTLMLDEIFYELCFNNSDHKCEECNKGLPKQFRDDNNKIIARFRYSHIVAKSIAPELRHEIKNINHLCHTCHFQWDHGDKKSMKIYEKNKLIFPQYLK